MVGSALGGALADRLFIIRPLDRLAKRENSSSIAPLPSQSESGEERTIAVVENSKPAVVTVSIKKQATNNIPSLLFPGYDFWGGITLPNQTGPVQQDIGTGFVVDSEKGLVVSNKHVVSDPTAEYVLIDADGNEHPVEKIYRDPVNDLAILSSNAKLPALPMANSDELRVGQSVVAIGTALGEFRQTVTSGIISGLGRGIDASDGFANFERIDNLIQTDAAINPGNSGGPLLNMNGEVIGVNVAVAQAENIGFALPINIVKESIANFDQTGQFERPLLGVQYKLIPKETAILNDVPEGAYITAVLPDSSAAKAGLQAGDILISIDGIAIKDSKGGLAGAINSKKVGETVAVDYWRNGTTSTMSITLFGAANP